MAPEPMIFVNYGGPKLDTRQRLVVRSRAMVCFRAGQRRTRHNTRERDREDAERAALAESGGVDASRNDVFRSGSGRTGLTSKKYVTIQPRPRELGQPPSHRHSSGIDAKVFQDYLYRCDSYRAYLDEGFTLVDFRKPAYFNPDMNKPACIYVGWLITAGIVDSHHGSFAITYPYYEWQAVRAMQNFIDQSAQKELHEIVHPMVILALFEVVRFNPHAVTHTSAIERLVKTRGGLEAMPQIIQDIVVMCDLLQAICLKTPVAFVDAHKRETHPQTATCNPKSSKFFMGSPLLARNADVYDSLYEYVDDSIRADLRDVLEHTGKVIHQVQESQRHVDVPSPAFSPSPDVLDNILANSSHANAIPRIILETCALASRIFFRTLHQSVGFDDSSNEIDMLELYDNLKFIGLRPWSGLPYVYIWLILIGLVSSTTRERQFFAAELVRCTFSFGCYEADTYTRERPLYTTGASILNVLTMAVDVLRNLICIRDALSVC